MYSNFKKLSDTLGSVDGFKYHHWNTEVVIKKLPALVIDSVRRNYVRIDKNADNPLYFREDIYDIYTIYRSNEASATIDTMNANLIRRVREMFTGQTLIMSNFSIENSLLLRMNIDSWQDTLVFNFPLKIERPKKRFE